MQSRTKILSLAARGKLPSPLGRSSGLDLQEVTRLYKEGLLQGVDVSTFDSPAFLDLSITESGRSALREARLGQTYWLTHLVLPLAVAVLAGIALKSFSTPAPEPEVACSYISIKALGWTSGHKTNFCIANGYPQGNFNWGDYKNGGICMAGDAEVCKAGARGQRTETYSCKPDGPRTVCYRRSGVAGA